MEIIKRGKLERHQYYCRKCGCVFTYVDREIAKNISATRITDDGLSTICFIECVECGHPIPARITQKQVVKQCLCDKHKGKRGKKK
jgi:hypothetical protein